MSNREIVINLLSKLPEDTSLEEIAREIELLAGIKTAREQTRRGEGIPAEDARKLVDTWARRFGNTLIDKALSIGTFPEMGQIVLEVGDPSVREIVHGSYRIIYELVRDPNSVFVLRFWHGARGTPDIN